MVDNLQQPTVNVVHHPAHTQLSIHCEIPNRTWNASGCQLYIGHEEKFYLKAPIVKGSSEGLYCHFAAEENDLHRRLQSVRSRAVSCDYTVNTESPVLSPRSDPHTIEGTE